MAKIQVNVPADIMKELSLYKIENNLERKTDAILKILKEFFKIK
jgi:hypothetical protein